MSITRCRSYNDSLIKVNFTNRSKNCQSAAGKQQHHRVVSETAKTVTRFVRHVRVTDKNKDALLMVRRRRVFLSRSFNYVSCALIIVRFTHFLLPTSKILAFVFFKV